MTILVVGGAGYIGSVTVEQLIAAGKTVVVLRSFLKHSLSTAIWPIRICSCKSCVSMIVAQ